MEQKTDDILSAFKSAKDNETAIEEKSTLRKNRNSGQQKRKNHNRQKRKQNVNDQKNKEKNFFLGVDGVKFTEEEWNMPVIKNGPIRKEIEEWKKKYGHVYVVPFEQDVYVFRALKRPEYIEIIKDQTLTAFDREEIFTEKCVLFPSNFSLEKIKKANAGVPSLLSEMIMDKSGFVARSAPIKL